MPCSKDRWLQMHDRPMCLDQNVQGKLVKYQEHRIRKADIINVVPLDLIWLACTMIYIQ